jgi:hypothetical protein
MLDIWKSLSDRNMCLEKKKFWLFCTPDEPFWTEFFAPALSSGETCQ